MRSMFPSVIERDLQRVLEDLAGSYPVLTVTGPRQAGKTTLCRQTFPDRAYLSLEAHDVREYARSDPRGLLADHPDGAILDEIQHAPELTSYLQVEVDENPAPGRFILTGSQHFGLTQAVSQSLAGRTAVLNLYPPSLGELRRFDAPPGTLDDTLWAGAYPRIHDRGIPAGRWLADYVTTYVQRDVRPVLNVGDLEAFTAFVRHCAGRTGQALNLSALGADVGVAHNTARAWLSVLEASFLVVRVPSWQRNLRKRLVKTPKLHFVDTGLACQLLGIAEPEQLRHHPLRGALFESWVAAEILKSRAHRGLRPALHHYRDARGHEVDLVVESERHTFLVEAKAGATIHSDFFAPLAKLADLVMERAPIKPIEQRLVIGGDHAESRATTRAVPWNLLHQEVW
jgi:predicted AAA+ superfamily ATPase